MENFDSLSKIVGDTITMAVQTQRIDIFEFLQRMEQEFTQLGFRENNMRGGVDNILIISLDAVGDFIAMTPAIREVRANYPSAHITMVVNNPVYPIAELCPYANEVITINQKNLNINNILELIWRVSDFAKKYLWRRRYRVAFCLRPWTGLDGIMMLYLCGARERVGDIWTASNVFRAQLASHGEKFLRLLFTHPIPHLLENRNDVMQTLQILKSYGLRVRDTSAEVWYDTTDYYLAKNLLADFAPGKMKIIVGIGAAVPARKYPIEKYLAAFQKIIDKGAVLVILGGPAEAEDAKFLQDNLPCESVKNLVEVHAGWRVDAAVIAQSDMYIGNDTGAMHISAVCHLPVIYLSRVSKDRNTFEGRPSETEEFFPWQTETILLQPEHQIGACAENPSVWVCDMPYAHCITQIEPDEIVAAFDTMVNFLKNSGIKKIGYPSVIRNF